MGHLLVATSDGLHELTDGVHIHDGRSVAALNRGQGRWLYVLDGSTVGARTDDGFLAEAVDVPADLNCVAEHGSSLILGSTRARLFDLAGGVAVEREDFASAPGRETWHTPWGGPPDVRSLAVDADGTTLYVNVHVGGVLRWTSSDPVWRATMPIDADVHEVVAHPERPGTVLVAAAWGFGVSTDRGDTWEWRTDGLHDTYCRAVAVSGDRFLVSASLGSRGREAAVYAGRLEGGRLERCADGLPEWFSTNVNTHCLALSGERAVIGDVDGTVFVSTDGGDSWEVAARLASVQAVGVT